ncbi:unnamed protein product [Rotaria socialis]|uniref:Uncharacterized protein n=1 Tax=Rotaria socialis TaxID=392032 RepID=A0A821WWL4_9BILA|nr:unnamed protein product [Rotaria socialis]
MGSEQSSLADSFDAAHLSINRFNRNRRQRLYTIPTRRNYALSNVKYQQRFDDNVSTISTNLSTVSLSTNFCYSKFTIPEEFPVEQLYDIYIQKHSLDDLAFAIEFKVSQMNCLNVIMTGY